MPFPLPGVRLGTPQFTISCECFVTCRNLAPLSYRSFARSAGASRRGLGVHPVPLDLDFALQVGAVFDRNAFRNYVADGYRRLLQFHPVGRPDIAVELPMHDHALGVDVGPDLAVGTDYELISRKFNASLHLSIDVEVLTAREFSLDNHRLTDVGKLPRLGHIHEASLGQRLRGASGISDSKSSRRIAQGITRNLGWTYNGLPMNTRLKLGLGMLRPGFRPSRSLGFILAAFLALPCAAADRAQIPPVDLVRRTVNNEIKANNGNVHYMFKDLKKTP